MFRRLTVSEWERLQGVPDGYTEIAGWPETQRRKSIGNAFCVNVMQWIGRRIDELSAHG
jgi:DNA (cytosine-5)-methyltransferase 1